MMRCRWVALMGVALLAACAERRAPSARPVLSTEQAPSPWVGPLAGALAAAPSDELPALAESWEEVRAFYERRAHAPLFLDDDGLADDAAQVVDAVRRAHEDGLRPERYGIDTLRAKVRAAEAAGKADPRAAIEAELALVNATLAFARDLSVGQTSPRDGGARWEAPAFSAATVLDRLVQHGPEATLDAARPQWPEYRALKEALAQHRELAARGGWPILDRGPILEPGADDPRVPTLRQRLLATGELAAADAQEGTRYDEQLVEAVKRFQRRHGLGEDGRVGGRTLKALRVSVDERIAQLELNLERWRWMQPPPDGRYVLVNVGGFELFAYEGRERALRMRVIAGLPDWQTPLFVDEIESLMIHPTWNVPKKILSREILPKLREDPEFANKVGLQVVDPEEGTTLPSSDVDWTTVDENAIGYRFRQAPGGNNPLGAIKFELPNRYAIYLHHTDNPKLFEGAERALSHGCVRVEDPLALAKFLLEPADDAFATVQTLIDEKRSQRVALPKKVPVQLAYFTAWKDDDGSVQFRDDLYGHDSRLAKALEREQREVRYAGTSTANTGAGERKAN